MKNMYDLMIFDLDGTILYTLDDLHGSLVFALKEHGLPVRSLLETRNMVGHGIRKLVERAVPEEADEALLEKVYDSFNDHYAIHHSDKTIIYDGILELLQELKRVGKRLAVVSNKSDYAVKPLMDHFFPDLFDMALGVREGVAKKPKPDLVLEVLTELNIKASQCIYIGDSEVDYYTALNAGMDYVLVSWGYRDLDFLEERGVEVILHSVGELKAYLLKNTPS